MKKYLFFIFLLSGCVSAPETVDIKFYEGPELSRSQVAIVDVAFTSPGERIQIGEKSYTYSKYEWVNFAVKPGNYQIDVDIGIYRKGIRPRVCEIDLEAGHEYYLIGTTKKIDEGYFSARYPYVRIVDRETKNETECPPRSYPGVRPAPYIPKN